MSSNALLLGGRILLAQIFIISGVGKLPGYAATAGYMEAMGVPGMMLPLVIAVEILAGIGVLVGLFTRWSALALAGFTLLAGLLFHFDLGDQMQVIQLTKNLAIAGGLLALMVSGPGAISLDARRGASGVNTYAASPR